MMACAINTNPNAASNPYGPPVAAFSPSDETVSQYDTVDFTDLSTQVPTSWSWLVNGSQFSIAKNPSYYFTRAGYYTIALTATNAYGSSSTSHQIHVLADGGGGGLPP